MVTDEESLAAKEERLGSRSWESAEEPRLLAQRTKAA